MADAERKVGRPDINPEQAAMLVDIFQKAEKTLAPRSIRAFDFTEPKPEDTDLETHYYYMKGDQSRSLLVVTTLPDKMIIIHNPAGKIVTLSYEEELFGTSLRTTLVKDQNGSPSVSEHYTNASDAVFTDILRAAHHRLEYADHKIGEKETI